MIMIVIMMVVMVMIVMVVIVVAVMIVIVMVVIMIVSIIRESTRSAAFVLIAAFLFGHLDSLEVVGVLGVRTEFALSFKNILHEGV